MNGYMVIQLITTHSGIACYLLVVAERAMLLNVKLEVQGRLSNWQWGFLWHKDSISHEHLSPWLQRCWFVLESRSSYLIFICSRIFLHNSKQ